MKAIYNWLCGECKIVSRLNGEDENHKATRGECLLVVVGAIAFFALVGLMQTLELHCTYQ